MQLLRDLMSQGKCRHELRCRQAQLAEQASSVMSREGLHLGKPTDLLRGDLDGDRSERTAAVFELHPVAVWRGYGDLAVIDEYARESRPSGPKHGRELVAKPVEWCGDIIGTGGIGSRSPCG